MKTGIFGGTFDPPHIGHLIAAQDAREALQLDRILFVPAREPPHKRERRISDPADRVAMLRAAIADEPRFQLCELELERAGPSYTVETLRALRAESPEETFFLLIGADQAMDLANWREPEEIARLATIVLLAREGVDAVPAARLLLGSAVRVTRVDIAATDIRQRVAEGRSIRFLVPAAVERVIREKKLYLRSES